jgi:predicted membrane-bound dolichyl-phosphate-mannose-protein mannosyltransferase
MSLATFKASFQNNFRWWLTGLIICAAVFNAWRYRGELFQITDREANSKAYSQSQYVLGDQAVEKIDDSTLYQFAAEAYFKGEDPATINFEHPPLGKYFFGLSLWLFDRALVINVLLYVGCLVLFANLMMRLKLKTGFIFLAVAYLAFGSSLDRHLRTALLDLQILFWSLGFFNVLFWNKESWLKYGLVGLTLGLLISTKYFFPIFFLYLGLVGIWTYWHKAWLKGIFAIIVAAVIYFLIYLQFFLHGHSIIDFIRFEWYRFKWWTGNRTIPKFILLQTLFLGKFPMWWETTKKYQFDSDWNLSWPILFVTYLVALVKQKFSIEQIVVGAYAIGLMTIYLFGSAVYGRYLLQLMPFWLITIAWALDHGKKQRA